MKKYVVCKLYGSEDITPTVIAHFDEMYDATLFASLSHMSDKEHNYCVYKLVANTL